jgi:NAD(P)H-hydrate epimerase
VCCGKGNNAGDGLVIARHLELCGIPVRVLLFGPPDELRGDVLANYCILAKSRLPIVDLSSTTDSAAIANHMAGAEWLVDALLGTGSSGPPRPPFDLAIRQMNACPAKRLAIDLPSGLDCDTGEAAEPTLQADHTCTFVAPKIGFAAPTARQFVGQVHVVDIGVPQQLLNDVFASPPA